jgi:hypothetical protein
MVRFSADLNGAVYLDDYKKNNVNTQLNKNRITILAIFGLSIVPFAIAWLLAQNPENVKLGTNHGELISPPLPTKADDFTGYDAFSSQNLQELRGHWLMINIVAESQCSEPCEEGLYKTQQISLMMGKDIARIRRVAMVYQAGQQPFSKQWQDDARLLKVVPATRLADAIRMQAGDTPPGGLWIMDPLGNLMMRYPPGYDPYKVRDDLSKLLRISQIG